MKSITSGKFKIAFLSKLNAFVLVLFGFLFATNVIAQNFEYFKRVNELSGGTGKSGATAMAICSDGSVVYAGYLAGGTFDMDPGPGVYTIALGFGGACTFIQKLDVNGNFMWVKTFENAYSPCFIDVDPSDNIFIAGDFEGTVDFDPDPSGVFNATQPVSHGPFLLKLDAAGTFNWVRVIENMSTSATLAVDVATTSTGNVLLCGRCIGTTDLDPGPGSFTVTTTSTFGSSTDAYVVNFDAAGNFVWAAPLQGDGYEVLNDISQDVSGNIYIGGYFVGGSMGCTMDANPGAGTLPFAITGADGDGFLIKLNSSGMLQWAWQLHGPHEDFIYSVANDANENVYLLGTTRGGGDFDPGPGTHTMPSPAAGSAFSFVEKLSPSGAFIWAKEFGEATYVDGPYSDINIDLDANLYSSAYYGGSCDLDPGPGIDTTETPTGTYFQKLDSAGNYVWGRSIQIVSYQTSMDPVRKKYYVASLYWSGPVDFDVSPLGTYMQTDTINTAFILRMGVDTVCANFNVVIDTIANAVCSSGFGFGNVHCIGGTAPYAFQWNTTPVTNTAAVNFPTNGIYTIVASDLNNCATQRNLVVGGFSSAAADLATTMVVPLFIKPGLNYNLQPTQVNKGCDTISGQFFFVHDGQVVINSVTPAPDFTFGDTLIWNFSSLNYDDGPIVPIINVSAITGVSVPSTTIMKTWITPLADLDPSNNSKIYNVPIKNAWDPNVKSVQPQGVCPEHYITNNQTMTYTVQFQNTGSTNAVNIYVLDTISANLDLTTLNILASSHYMYTEVLPGNVLKFNFDNINLADSASNEAASHGYLIYEINQQPSLADGLVLNNTAYIYFDNNPAVITNTAFNTIISVLPSCSATGLNEQASSKNIVVYPNPTNSFITVISKTSCERITFTNVYGQVVKSVTPKSMQTQIDLTDLTAGIYFVTVISGEIKQSLKVMKE
jgi:uncharacterized repeat protein (TIGR01451 family)